MRKIDTLYIHYSASGDLGNAQQTRATIDAWHKARGFKMIGYHAGCTPRGERFIGRPDEMVGAHVKFHNANSLGYCNVGSDLGITPWFPTQAQYEDCAAWCREKMAKYGISITNVKGHRDDGPTSCPGPFDVHGRLKKMIAKEPQPKEDDDMGTMNVCTSGTPVTAMGYHGFIGRNVGQGVVENVYAKASNLGDKVATVTFRCSGGGKNESISHKVVKGGYKEVNCAEFRINGPVFLQVASESPMVISFDHRGRDI